MAGGGRRLYRAVAPFLCDLSDHGKPLLGGRLYDLRGVNRSLHGETVGCEDRPGGTPPDAPTGYPKPRQITPNR